MENPISKWMIWVVFPYFWKATHIITSHHQSPRRLQGFVIQVEAQRKLLEENAKGAQEKSKELEVWHATRGGSIFATSVLFVCMSTFNGNLNIRIIIFGGVGFVPQPSF